MLTTVCTCTRTDIAHTTTKLRPPAGSCASGGGSTYYLNPALEPTPEDKSNKLWFTNATVPANGSIAGNGANDGLIRLTAQGADKPAVKSMMLVETSTGGEFAVLCCAVV